MLIDEPAMSQPSRPKYVTVADWDAAYREGTPAWDAGRPHAELARVVGVSVMFLPISIHSQKRWMLHGKSR